MYCIAQFLTLTFPIRVKCLTSTLSFTWTQVTLTSPLSLNTPTDLWSCGDQATCPHFQISTQTHTHTLYSSPISQQQSMEGFSVGRGGEWEETVEKECTSFFKQPLHFPPLPGGSRLQLPLPLLPFFKAFLSRPKDTVEGRKTPRALCFSCPVFSSL